MIKKVKIIKFEYYNQETLIEKIRKVHLKGRPETTLYKNADITLERNINPDDIHFPQYYVLEKDLREITRTREELLEYGVDIFKLIGFVRVFYRDEEDFQEKVFDTLPPVVEISEADGGIPLLNDGMHRLYLAREAGSAVNIVKIQNFNHSYPYYALPNEAGWNNLKRCEEVPDIKKNYRIKEYKTLFRDFNTAFINVTQSRTDKEPKVLKVAGEKVDVGT